MDKLVLLILLNLPNGQQVEQSRILMSANQCQALSRIIWDGPNEVAFYDAQGVAVPVLDAACVPAAMLLESRP